MYLDFETYCYYTFVVSFNREKKGPEVTPK